MCGLLCFGGSGFVELMVGGCFFVCGCGFWLFGWEKGEGIFYIIYDCRCFRDGRVIGKVRIVWN